MKIATEEQGETYNFIPVVGHNIQNYDLYHIFLALNNCEPTTTISVITATDKNTYLGPLVCSLIPLLTKKDNSEGVLISTVYRLLQNDE